MDGKIIFRNDDVSPNTDLEGLYPFYEMIGKFFEDSYILSAVSLFGRTCKKGAVYPDLPLKDQPKEYFYDVDRFLHRHTHVIGDIASHGLFHVKHSELPRDAQEMSIISSCSFLGTNLFVAPFNDYDDVTKSICHENDIELVNASHDWRSLEFNKFDPKHKYWFFHSWRWDLHQFREKLNAGIIANR